MRTQIIYLSVISFVLLFCFSCSQEETSTFDEPQPIKLQLEFESSSENEQEAILDTYDFELVSISPLDIESEELEVIKITDPETNEIVELIIPKSNNQESNANPCEYKMEESWAFNPETQCFYRWGWRFQFENCTVKYVKSGNPSPPTVCLTDLALLFL